ncbi:MAG: Abi family protein, partial [Promicromonosporaceae bacterium]|nr:Abi family protein [Promicromonosporaceae bacterium]
MSDNPESPVPPKHSTDIQEQIEILSRRGVVFCVEDPARWLQSVSYYRLSSYAFPYREPAYGEETRFRPGTRFDDITRLYEFDRKLRTLVHDAMERVEVLIRSAISQELAGYGATAYQDPLTFRSGFKHGSWLNQAYSRVERARRSSDPVIQHHDDKYGGVLPVWVLVQFLDFSDLSILFEGLKSSDQWKIAQSIGINVNLNEMPRSKRA